MWLVRVCWHVSLGESAPKKLVKTLHRPQHQQDSISGEEVGAGKMDDSLSLFVQLTSGHLAAKGGRHRHHRRSHSAPMGPPVLEGSSTPLSQQNSASG